MHGRFVKKLTRDEILKKARNEPLQYKGKEILILKQIPGRVRDLRKQYQFLTAKLIKRDVNFRQLVPERILVDWGGKRYRLDLLDKAIVFYDSYFSTNEGQEAQGEMVCERQEEPLRVERSIQQEESEMEKAEQEGARA